MSGSAALVRPALRGLERALLRRRFAALDLRLRLEFAAFALLATGFFAWQARIPLDALARHRGPGVTLVALAIGAGGLLAIGALVAGLHHRRVLESPGGPPWLALPFPPAEIAAHLARLSATWALWAAVPALGGLAAALGLVAPAGLGGLAIAFFALLLPAGRVGAALSAALLARAAPGAGARHPIERLLWSARPAVARGRLRPARWRRSPAWLALGRKDLALSLRPGPLRRRLLSTLAFATAAVLLWGAPLDPGIVPFAAFAIALLAATSHAEWIVELCGSDPFAVVRALPVGVTAVWGARLAWALAGALLIGALQALAHPAVPALARYLQPAWSAFAALLIGILGANYGVTLFPRSDHALRMLSVTLGVAMAASLMIPLLGWVMLLTGILHSARRLPRWRALEES